MEINNTLNKVFNTAFNIAKNTFDLEKDLQLTVSGKHGSGHVSMPVVADNITLSYEWRGAPGKLDFKVLVQEDKPGQGINYIVEGDQVSLVYKGENIFLGYVFTRKIDKNNIMQITAYDQLRYLKNKNYYYFENVTATEIIKRIAEDFQLKIGELEDTVYKFESRREDNKTLIDIILTALSLTTQNTKKMYTLYDQYGELTLKEMENMKITDFIIDDLSASDFDYSSSIDSDVYNQIKLTYPNKETKKRENYIVYDSSNIERWGLLQLYETIDEKINGKEKADNLIKLYNSPKRKFSIKKAFGDIRIKGGSSFLVMLKMGELDIKNYMIVESVKHTFNFGEYFMDLNLIKHIKEKEESAAYTSTSNTEVMT